MLVVGLSQHNEHFLKQNQIKFVNYPELLIAVLLYYISLIFVLFFTNRSQTIPTFWSQILAIFHNKHMNSRCSLKLQKMTANSLCHWCLRALFLLGDLFSSKDLQHGHKMLFHATFCHINVISGTQRVFHKIQDSLDHVAAICLKAYPQGKSLLLFPS